MVRLHPVPQTWVVEILTFTPRPPVSGPVIACAGTVELVDGARCDCSLPDHRRIYRVRSVETGAECWAYLGELMVHEVA
jgi:hypothetical protein